jgi:hypothetical protein
LGCVGAYFVFSAVLWGIPENRANKTFDFHAEKTKYAPTHPKTPQTKAPFQTTCHTFGRGGGGSAAYIFGHGKTPQTTPKRPETPKNATNHHKTPRKQYKTTQNTRITLYTPKHPKKTQTTPKHHNNTTKHPKIRQNAVKHPKQPQNTAITPLNTPKQPKTP